MDGPGEQFDDAAVKAYVAAAIDAVATAGTVRELEDVAAGAFGPNSQLLAWRKALGGVDPGERPAAGQRLNAARTEIDAAVAERRAALEHAERLAALAADRLDLTEVPPTRGLGHRHLITQVREELEDVFIGMGFEIAEGPEVESEWYNFTALNMPRYHPARSIQDSFYLDIGDGESWLLRSQTSPTQIRLLERGDLPIYAIAPGRVYRRDTPDATHLPVFHQIEGLVVDEGVSFADLAGTVDTFVKAIYGDSVASRLRPGYFPFTEPSAEFDASCVICSGTGCRTCSDTGWIELGGCGMVHPAVFEAVGVDPERWTGFAFGFGIDRLAMMRHEISDLRALMENDVRLLRQF
jgi:phenylalanyl-tRNA synthetase alpha chain